MTAIRLVTDAGDGATLPAPSPVPYALPAVQEALITVRRETFLAVQAIENRCPYYALDTLKAARRALDEAERAIRTDLAARA